MLDTGATLFIIIKKDIQQKGQRNTMPSICKVSNFGEDASSNSHKLDYFERQSLAPTPSEFRLKGLRSIAQFKRRQNLTKLVLDPGEMRQARTNTAITML